MRLGSAKTASEVRSLSRWERVGVRGYGLSLLRTPSPDLHWTMLRIARSKSTSPHRGEVHRMRGRTDSIKIHHALACAPEPARGVAGNRVAPHARLAHVNTLAELPCVIARVTLGDAGTLLIGVLDFLRTRRKAKSHRCPRNEVSQLHGTLSKCSPLNAPRPLRLDRAKPPHSCRSVSPNRFCRIVFKISA